MAEYRITCINKDPRHNSHESIQFLGVTDLYNNYGKYTLSQLIDYMKQNPIDIFYTLSPTGKKVFVGIIPKSDFRREHLRTYADGVYTNNLLELPECFG